MKSFTLFLIFTTLSVLYATIQTKPSVKPNVAVQKKTKCCSIQRTFKNKINLNEICVDKEITKIKLQVVIPYTMCSNLTDIGLTDENGKSYEIVSMQNISTCPKIQQVDPGHIFYWNFQTLDKGISALNLTENKKNNLSPTFPNWEFWYWENISVSHCKF